MDKLSDSDWVVVFGLVDHFFDNVNYGDDNIGLVKAFCDKHDINLSNHQKIINDYYQRISE